MARRFDHPPSLDEIEAIARAAMAGLPEPFAAHLGGIVLVVEEMADEELARPDGDRESARPYRPLLKAFP